MSMDIRLATPGDAEDIASIYRHATLETIATFAISPVPVDVWRDRMRQTETYYPWLVAELDGIVAGFAKGSPYREHDAYSHTVETTIYLAPNQLRRGTGRALMERLIQLLRQQRYHTALAVTTAENEGGRAFHRALGMQEVGTIDALGWKFGAWYGVTTLSLALQPVGSPPATIRTVLQAIADAPERA